MSDDLAQYPCVAVAMGNGDLIQVTNVKLKMTNGAKLKHAPQVAERLRSRTPRVLGLDGDRDPRDRRREGRFDEGEKRRRQPGAPELPADTHAVNIVASSMDLELPSDEATTRSIVASDRGQEREMSEDVTLRHAEDRQLGRAGQVVALDDRTRTGRSRSTPTTQLFV
jgi:hypothetical protein